MYLQNWLFILCQVHLETRVAYGRLKGFSFWDILMADYSGASHQSVRFDDR